MNFRNLALVFVEINTTLKMKRYRSVSSCVTYQVYEFDLNGLSLEQYAKLRIFVQTLGYNSYPSQLSVLHIKHPLFFIDFPGYGFPTAKISFYPQTVPEKVNEYLEILNGQLAFGGVNMNEKSSYVIKVGELFKALNGKRVSQGLSEIDSPLIASKLGILFALKTNGYVNFKGEIIDLNDNQLIALQEILDQHFNAEMSVELRQLIASMEHFIKSAEAASSETTVVSEKKGLFNKFKGLFKSKLHQESHA